MPATLDTISKLIQEQAVIRHNMDRITDLSEDMVVLADVQKTPPDFTPYQYAFLNNRRVKLRQNLARFINGLQIHYQTVDKVLQPLLGEQVKKCLQEQHSRTLQKLAETDELLLNLSPAGILFNRIYLKQKLEAVGRAINSLSSMEGSLLEIIEVYLC